MSTEGSSTFTRARASIFKHRKFSLAFLTMLLAAMVLPTAAMAAGHDAILSPSATGEITSPSNRVVQPKPALGLVSQPFVFRVANNDLPLPVLGKSIDFVRISLPTDNDFTFPTGFSPLKSGWTASVVSDSGDQYVDFRANDTNAEIAPSNSADFPISVYIERPPTDILAPFTLSVSSDGGDTMRPVVEKTAGALKADVRILAIKWWIPFQPNIARGTEGQLIRMYHTTINLGSEWMTVTPTVASGVASDIGALQVFPYSVPPNDFRTQQVWITLGSVTADKTAVFTAGVVGRPTPSSPLSTAPVTVNRNYTIQSDAQLNLGQFAPGNANGSNTYSFSVGVTKTSTAALTVNSGTLTFESPITSTAATLLNAPTSTSFATGTQNRTFTYSPVNFSAPGLSDGVYDVTFTFSTTDHNGFAKIVTQTLSNALTLDVQGPLFEHVGLELPTDRDGDPTTAVRNGVALTVTGTVAGATAVPAAGLEVLDSAGNVISTIPSSAASMTSLGGGRHKFTAAIPATSAQYGAGVAVRPTATATDGAGNSSTRRGSNTPVDNIKPTLTGATATVEPVAGKNPVIRVEWVENNQLIGGCDPLAYTLTGAPTGVAVEKVLYSNGQDCVPGAAGSDNVRVLRLTGALNRSHAPLVTYEDQDGRDPAPAGSSPLVPPLDDDAKDAAGGYASDGVTEGVQSVSKLVPNAPSITAVTRSAESGGRESARQNSSSVYFTRVAGNDLEITVSRDQGITTDRLRIVHPNGDITTSTVGATSSLINVLNDMTVTQTVEVSFVSNGDVEGQDTVFKVRFDNVRPTQQDLSRSGSSVTATFTEEVVGTNSASHWTAFETVGTTTRSRTVRSVTGSGTTRILDVDFAETSSTYSVRYRFPSGASGSIYQDLAGNSMLSPTSWPTKTMP